MSKSRIIRMLITAGDNEEILTTLIQERHPNQFGEITPPVMVEYEGIEYILKRKWTEDVYVYGSSDRRRVDDFLATAPSE